MKNKQSSVMAQRGQGDCDLWKGSQKEKLAQEDVVNDPAASTFTGDTKTSPSSQGLMEA